MHCFHCFHCPHTFVQIWKLTVLYCFLTDSPTTQSKLVTKQRKQYEYSQTVVSFQILLFFQNSLVASFQILPKQSSDNNNKNTPVVKIVVS
mmetsp:Transcript_21420/g.52933  ORF Transcript_21420/g.52933 Transcript_21420/m.52933 type:complete len:91 (-) Transcript_21420:210-482(-)